MGDVAGGDDDHPRHCAVPALDGAGSTAHDPALPPTADCSSAERTRPSRSDWIQGVTLNDHHRPAKSRPRTCRRGQTRPPDLAFGKVSLPAADIVPAQDAQTIGRLRPPLAGRRALHDLPAVVPLRHRHDVLGFPERQRCRSAGAIARAGPVDDPALAGGSLRQARRRAAAGSRPPHDVRRTSRLSFQRPGRSSARLRRHRGRADRRVWRDDGAHRVGLDRTAGKHRDDRGGRGSRSVDHPRRVPESPAR